MNILKLPREISICVSHYLSECDRMHWYSIVLDWKKETLPNQSYATVGDIFQYFNDTNDNREKYNKDLNRFLCQYAEWLLYNQFDPNEHKLHVSDITAMRCRHTEKHFSEFWTNYGATISYDKYQWTAPPPKKWDRHFIDYFIDKWLGRNEELKNYGYRDY